MRQEWRGGPLKPPDLYEGGRRGGGGKGGGFPLGYY